MNIWYNIAEGHIDIEDHKEVKLIAPGTNIIEFASTENFFSNINLVKSALQALHNHGELIDFEAFDYIITHYVDVEYEADKKYFMGEINEFELFIDGEIGDFFEHAENIRKFNEKIEKINAPAQKYADDLTDLLPKIRQKGKEDKGTTAKFNETLKNDSLSYIHVIRMIRDIIAMKLNLSEDDLKGKILYDNFELFFLAWDSFLENKITSVDKRGNNGAKVKINDIYDLTNLAYVGANDLYWTEDKYWLKLIYQNPKTRKYIYNLDSRHLPNTEEEN